MASRSGFTGVVTAIARETARQQRAAEAEQRRALREAVRLERERKKEQALADKAARQRYLEARADEVKRTPSSRQK